VTPTDPFARSPLIPEFAEYAAFAGGCVGLTGARGVLGSLAAARLEAHGVAVAAYPGDVNDEPALAEWFERRRFSHFLHFAAMVPVSRVDADPVLAFQTNVVGSFNVCKQLARTQRDCWLFHCSTSHVYAPTAEPTPIAEDAPTVPTSYYGATKLAAERVVDTLMTRLRARYCIGRVFSYTHARQQPPYLVPSLRQKIAALPEGATLEIENASAVRDIQDAGQVVDAILQLARRGATGTVNIGSGVGVAVGDIARAVARSLGRAITVGGGGDGGTGGALVADTSRLQRLLATDAGAR
jgi:nucleoside-diphosphate-sugar epimerase